MPKKELDPILPAEKPSVGTGKFAILPSPTQECTSTSVHAGAVATAPRTSPLNLPSPSQTPEMSKILKQGFSNLPLRARP